MSENNMKKKLDDALRDAPEVKKYSIEKLEKMGHTGPTCPKTGKLYEERVTGRYVICSECHRTLYPYRRIIKSLIN